MPPGQSVSHYAGLATGAAAHSFAVTLNLFKTVAGGLVGVVMRVGDPTGGLTVKFDSNGHFLLNAADHSPRLEGQLSADMKTITGTFTGASVSESGTFTLTRT